METSENAVWLFLLSTGVIFLQGTFTSGCRVGPTVGPPELRGSGFLVRAAVSLRCVAQAQHPGLHPFPDLNRLTFREEAPC